MYGMFVCDFGNNKHGDNPFANKANIVETRIANRVKPLHYGVRYNDEPLTFNLIFGAEEVMDRYQIQEVAKWLTGYQEYQWLSIDQPDLDHIQFRCLIQSLTPISVRWLPMAFEAKIICDTPYGYSYPFEQKITINGETPFRFYNDGSSRELLKPIMEVALEEGCTNFSVTNRNTDETMSFTNLPAGGLHITIDNENGVITESTDGYNMYDYFNFVFLGMESGDNMLVFDGVGEVIIKGRYIYNIGA